LDKRNSTGQGTLPSIISLISLAEYLNISSLVKKILIGPFLSLSKDKRVLEEGKGQGRITRVEDMTHS
jgi:hypothetical protein